MQTSRPIKTALISVSDKTGIVEFAQALHQRQVSLLSTGGTAKLLKKNQIPVTEVSEHTGFPEIMEGRVKTLHPKIHGGILARRGQDESILKLHQIDPIDMVIVNLYPFEKTIENLDCSLEDAIENIDIGGPSMIRAAAKNYQDVAVVVQSNQYHSIIQEMDGQSQSVSLHTRFKLAASAFEHTASYDRVIANYFQTKQVPQETDSPLSFPDTFSLQLTKKQALRYGENSHQQAAFYVEGKTQEASVSTATQIQGKTLSYNNIADTDAALECVKEFDDLNQAACVIVKHANPCGVATGNTLLDAYNKAYQTDPTSAFGGIIAFNQMLDEQTAKAIIARQFVEVIIAPKVSEQAIKIISSKKNIRLLESGQWQTKRTDYDMKKVTGGLLIQQKDLGEINASDISIVSKRQPTSQQISDALFAWKVAKYVKSNAIVYAKNNMTIGIGAGQMSRVYSAKIASIKAQDENLEVAGSVMASDAFFPFRDGIDTADAAGIQCIIQPGGSIRDDEIIQAANEHDIAMIFTNMRHFRH